MSKVTECQSYTTGRFTAAALMDFHNDLRECYRDDVWMWTFGAVGPIHAFLGWLVKTGQITISDSAGITVREPRRLTLKERLTGKMNEWSDQC